MIRLALYLATIPAANWMIGNVGTICMPGGPCLVPVGLGLTAPSGVLLIGIAVVLRDLVHRDLGARWAATGIAVGSALSFAIAPPQLALASFVAFAVSEALDQVVYTPLRHRRLVLAVVASGVVGAIADSALFLWLAFGSLDHVAGQVVGKLWMVGAAASFLWLRSRRRPAAAAS
ncbi:MAG: VUT family protein [Amaricoccus sp.]